MKEVINKQNYYENYGFLDSDLNAMHDHLKSMGLPDDILEMVNEKESANILILGSATTQNLNGVSKIDKYFRPDKVEQDKVIIIDKNFYPLSKHKKDIDWIEGKDGWTNQPKSTPQFPYPKFELAQADMSQLPFADHKIDIVISDYTLNFLDDLNQVDKTFQEISSSLSENGIALISFRGNEKYPPGQDNQINNENDKQEHTLRGGVTVHYFPLTTYFNIAKKYNLEAIKTNSIGTDTFAVFIKKETKKN
ncbi:hypothetical protein A2331_00585 [Candidatus Falkowbacteria bacterium RIFOXYB2_FULL_34_18]|uniref:Methyltransferase type 11 domain-containing protein n=1 Tax=Candidatus Falkowbacteria bacterium RIFOXYD2_FULL_34_120 TaxID=1798007 RepID=A0A1F5TM54_9BACT|nr:MAG: hypothetical protein A2331_00585 [Candidatus Falkowbacteria bacterium RIFOXYB2_FULL_34_18]OGF29188.1 MAG: hypothetical protein A2500_05900 [Candidatus Falkowbacteria bacterium RIFOXYC12_FULL_34_55]OGF37726.1 MAG: hypothetical protein A2466_06230 [Candidatus Falkowbacteria bacterium RIFOXYC2_FULL_34_220]OGF38710.1 MAG: hypothetical protein A2515_01565 [Candidatus Falkowbacteria bacterium RIFOXYD12_FULL_34_57]OGF39944.1 MAG: hypothetical protein A2531_01820 [Candidatus Falkowbacteria bact